MDLITFDPRGYFLAAFYFMLPLSAIWIFFIVKGKKDDKISIDFSRGRKFVNWSIFFVIFLNLIDLLLTGNLLYTTLPFLALLILFSIISRKKKMLFNFPMVCSKRALLMGIGSIVYMSLLYWWLFGSIFYIIEISDSSKEIHLIYFVPERQVVFDIQEIKSVSIQSAKQPYHPRENQIVIQLVSGKEYRSRPFYKHKTDRVREQMTPLLETIEGLEN